MLLRFVFENVLSFKEETDFNLLPAKSLKSFMVLMELENQICLRRLTSLSTVCCQVRFHRN